MNYLCKVSYKGKTEKEDFALRKKFNHHHDEEHNNFLHFMYMVNVSEITETIKLSRKVTEELLSKMNLQGKLPEERRHAR